MPIQPILQGDIPELRQVSTPVLLFDDSLKTLIADLVETLKAHRGLGLSAPQIGVPKRVFAIDIDNTVSVYINPEIISARGESPGYESCLSLPDYTLSITRPTTVTLKAQNELGEWQERTVCNQHARVICHELDHLDGVLFIDHLSDEEIFSQVLGNAEFIEDDDVQENEQGEVDIERHAMLEELQLSVDMLSELSWKLMLSLEMIKDYEQAYSKQIPWDDLEQLSSAIETTISTVEQYIESEQVSSPQNGGILDES